MIRAALGLAAALLPMGAAAARPARVMSIGLCADQYVLALLPPERITSVTRLARDASSPAVARAAARVPLNRQSAEEVLRQRPDLVVADAFSDATTLSLLRRLHVPMVELPYATDFAAIRAATLDLGRRTAASGRATYLAGRIDMGLKLLAAQPLGARPRVASWDGSGNLPPQGSLYDAVIDAAGARNLGRQWRKPFRVEALLATRPDFLLHDDQVLRSGARVASLVGHPLVRRLYGDRHIVIAQEQLVCGTPWTIDAALRLHRDLRTALMRARS